MEICKCFTEGQSSEYSVTNVKRAQTDWKIYFLFTYIVGSIILLGVVGRSVGFLFIRPSWRGILPTVLLPTPARYTF